MKHLQKFETFNESIKKALTNIGLATALAFNPGMNKAAGNPTFTQSTPPEPKFPYKNFKDFAQERRNGQLTIYAHLSEWAKRGLYLEKYLLFLKKYGEWVTKYKKESDVRKWQREYDDASKEYAEWIEANKNYTEPVKDIVDSRKTKNVSCDSKEGAEVKRRINSLQYK